MPNYAEWVKSNRIIREDGNSTVTRPKFLRQINLKKSCPSCNSKNFKWLRDHQECKRCGFIFKPKGVVL